MRLLAVPLLFSLLPIVYGGPTARVVGGEDAANGDYPYQVQIIHKRQGFICGGSILNERHILTAAHCLTVAKPSELMVIVGTNDRESKEGTLYQVDSHYGHEKYDSQPEKTIGPIHDIGIIHLNKNIQFNAKVQPVKLPATIGNTYDNDVATLTGWGRLKLGGNVPLKLQQIDMKVLDLASCNQMWGDFIGEKIEETKICTISRVGQGTCHGDSGGPLVLNGVQIGVVSFGWPCGTGVPDVFTRVSSYLPWILKHSALM